MIDDSYGHFDKPYRRGLILGLSLAELFLILIFLLLLVAISIVQFLEEEKEEIKEEFQDQLVFFREQVGDEITIEEFGELVEKTKQHQDALNENEILNQKNEQIRDELQQKDAKLEKAEVEIKAVKSELDEASKENEQLSAELEQAKNEIEELKSELAKEDQETEGIEEVKSALAEANEENERLRAELEQAENEIEGLKSELAKEGQETEGIEEVKSALAEANKEKEQLIDELGRKDEKFEEVMSELAEVNKENEKQKQVIGQYERAKIGQDPPCWFVVIPDADEVDGKRHKHVKIFDVLIKDESFRVRWHDNSKITRVVDKGNESAIPPMNLTFLNRDLGEKHFTAIFSRFKEVGESKQIQSYKCRFMVDVYDQTSSYNKDGYKYNLSVVENIFYKYEEIGQW